MITMIIATCVAAEYYKPSSLDTRQHVCDIDLSVPCYVNHQDESRALPCRNVRAKVMWMYSSG
jgi:hypothetical protein